MRPAARPASVLLTATWAITLLGFGMYQDACAGEAPGREAAAMTSARKPEDWPGVFERHLNAGDLDAVVALYDPDARFVPKSGETLVGRDAIRPVLAKLIRTRTQFHGRVVKVLTVGDVAVLYTDFEGTTVDPSGSAVEVRSRAMEVLRRQPDGTWLLIVGDPNARG